MNAPGTREKRAPLRLLAIENIVGASKRGIRRYNPLFSVQRFRQDATEFSPRARLYTD